MACIQKESEMENEVKKDKVEAGNRIQKMGYYIAKLEEYIEFLTKLGKVKDLFFALHGQEDFPRDIAKGIELREELSKLKLTL
jgi:hypothetical protein